MNCCRLCSSLSRDAVAIFGDEGVNMKLAYKINKCLPLVVSLSDKLPRHVCRKCIGHLDSTSKFITKCLHTQFILEKKLKFSQGKEDTPLDEVCVLWSNVNFESEDVHTVGPSNAKEIPDQVTVENHSHEDDSQDYCSPVNSPAASEEIEIVNQGECNEKSARGLTQVSRNPLEETVRVESLSDMREKSKDSNNSVFQGNNGIISSDKPTEKTNACVLSGNYISGNKENDVASYGQMVSQQRMRLSEVTRRHRKHSCKYCNSCFRWKAELFYHQTTSHPESVFRCRYCLKVFYDSNEEYTKHVAAHKVINAPRLTKKQVAISELHILKQNAALGVRYDSVLNRSISKIPTEATEEHAPENERTRVDVYKSLFDDVVKHLSEKNTGEKILGTSNESDEETGLGDVSERKRKRIDVYKSLFDDVVKHLTEKKTGGKILETSNEPEEENKTYKCEWCDYKCQKEELLRLHLRYHHKLRLPCRFCPRTLVDKKQFLNHEARHKTEKKYRCRKCSIEFDTEGEWKDHKKFHFQEQEHVCKLCGKKFDKIWSLRQHAFVHKEEKTCLCHKCGKSFRFITSLRLHSKACGVDPETAKKNVCRYCGKRYLVPSMLRVHERVHTGEKPFMCSLCGKTFHSNERLRNHSLSHVIENVPCPICGFVLKHSRHLKNHLKSHERVQCKTCGLWFDGTRKLGCHQRVHKKAQVVKEDRGVVVVAKKNSEEENLSVPQMMVRFPVVIGIENPSLPVDDVQQGIESSKMFQPLDKPFACPHCPQKFVLHQSYLKHIKQHSNNKPLYCPDCGGISQSMDDLVRHYYSHFVGSKFYCNLCGESFDRKISMIEHKRTHKTKGGPIGDTLLRKRLLMLQPQESLVFSGSAKNDVTQISIPQVGSQVVVGNPECEGGEYLTFDSHSIDSHCSEVIVVSSVENMT